MSHFLHHCPTCGIATTHLFIRVEEHLGSRNIGIVACGECDDDPYRVEYSSQLPVPTCTATRVTEQGRALDRKAELSGSHCVGGHYGC